MKAITGAMYMWGEDKHKECSYNPHSKESSIYRIKYGYTQPPPATSRNLGYDPHKRDKVIIQVNRAWLNLGSKQKECVFGKFVATQILVDGNPLTARDIAGILGLSKESFDENWSRGVRRINGEVIL